MKIGLKLLIVILLSPYFLLAQNKIVGKVVNHENEPVMFAEIILTKLKTEELNINLSSENGVFQISDVDKGSYRFEIKYWSKKVYSDTLKITENLNLGDILIDAKTHLQEVVVTAKLKMQNKIDKYEITNISNSSLAKNRSTLEFLNTIPLVNVSPDKKTVSLNNKKNVNVLINGRKVGGNDIAISMIQSIPAIDIKRIEIIQNPGSKYKAGNTAIVNVIVNKSQNKYSKVIVGGSTSQSYYNSQNIEGYVSFSQKKWSLTGGLDIDKSKDKSKDNNNYYDYLNDALTQYDDNYTSESTYYTPFLNMDYTISDNQRIGMQLSSKFIENNTDRSTTSKFYNLNNKLLDSINDSKINSELNNYDFFFYNLNHEITVDSLGSNLKTDFNYYYLNKDDEIFNSFSYNNGREDKFLQNPAKTTEIFEFKSDFEKRFANQSQITAGYDFTNTSIRNNNFYGESNGLDYIPDPTQTNIFTYQEDYLALYINYKKMFAERMGIIAGLRYEYFKANGALHNSEEKTKIANSNLFPTFGFFYSVNDNHQLILELGSSIKRTPYTNLNPFTYHYSSNYYRLSNPYLENTKDYMLGLTYTFFEDFNLQLGYRRSNNLFNNFDTVLENGDIVQTTDNYGDGNYYGGDFYFNKSFIKNCWNLSFSMSLEFSDIKGSYNQSKIDIYDSNFSFNAKNNIFLDKEKSALVMLNYGFDNGWEDIYGKINAQHSLTLEVSKSIKNLYLCLGAYDLLSSDTDHKHRNNEYGFDKKSKYYKTYYLQVRYTFGNKKVKTVNSKGKNINGRL